jgi:hypothetical protein
MAFTSEASNVTWHLANSDHIGTTLRNQVALPLG